MHFRLDLVDFIHTNINQKGPTSSFLGKNFVLEVQKTEVDRLCV